MTEHATSKKIVVLQRGWVFVGDYYYDPSTDMVSLTDASCIRYWGTTQGLGELVNGPTEKTRLDPSGRVEFHILTQVFSLDVDEKAW